jgi:hypothetical protein
MKSAELITACIAVLLTGCTQVNSQNTPTSNSMKINLITSPSNITAKLIIPGATGLSAAKSKMMNVPAQEIKYEAQDGPGFTLIAVQDPLTRTNYIVPSSDFYVSDDSGMTAFHLSFGSLMWRRSYFEMPDSAGDLNATVAQFVTAFDDGKLKALQKNFSFVKLLNAATPAFFTANSAGGSQPATGTISDIELSDGILRLDLLSPGGKFKGTFWINLKAQKIVKSTIDGTEMNLSDSEFAVPLKKN